MGMHVLEEGARVFHHTVFASQFLFFTVFQMLHTLYDVKSKYIWAAESRV